MSAKNTHKHSIDFLAPSRLVKTIELIILAVFEVVLFFFLLFNEDLHSAIFGNKYLFVICSVCWVILIVGFIFILIDFILMKNIASKTHGLTNEAYNDALTGLPNRHSIDLMIKLASDESTISNIGCVLVRLTNLKIVNITEGHAKGDALILDFCQLMIAVCNSYGFIGRNGGNDFLCIFEDCSEDTIHNFIIDLHEQIQMYNINHGQIPIEIEYSYVCNNVEFKSDISDLITIVYRKIEEAPLQ